MGMVLCDRERNSNATRLAEKNIDVSQFSLFIFIFLSKMFHIFLVNENKISITIDIFFIIYVLFDI